MTNRKIRTFFIIFIIFMFSAFTYIVFQYSAVQYIATNFEGSGTLNNPYLIKDETDYLHFANCINNGEHYEDIYFALDADLDYSKINTITGITDSDYYFAGYFDGRGHKFSNVNISTGEEPAGLFNNLNGFICNVIIENGHIEGEYAGAIAGSIREHAEILNCLNKAEITGKSTYGIAGKQLMAEISNCISYSTDEEGQQQVILSRMIEDDRNPITHEISNKQLENDCDYLNHHLNALSTYYAYPNWYAWSYNGNELQLTENAANVLVKMTTNITLDKESIFLNAYWGLNDTWYFSIPAGWNSTDISIELEYSDGQSSTCTMESSEQELSLQDTGYNFHIMKLISQNVPSIMINTTTDNSMHYLHFNKMHILPGSMNMFSTDGSMSYNGYVEELAGHGHDSWKTARKKSYNIKLASEAALAGMGNSKDFALLSAYRNNSLLSYMIAQQIEHDANIPFAPDTEPVNFYLDGTFMGVYLLSERPELAFSRIEVPNGLLLEFNRDDYVDWEYNFFSDRDIIITVKNRILPTSQAEYIQQYWQDFEDALFAENGYNDKGIYYADYIDLTSFADQWLMYELCGEQSIQGSVYYYKESDTQGDGLLHAAYVWDMENSFTKNPDVLYLSSNTNHVFQNYWGVLYSHDDFAQKVLEEWENTFSPIVSELLNASKQSDDTESLSILQTNQIYQTDFFSNVSKWPSCDLNEKTISIYEYLSEKSHFLDNALPLYTQGFDYIIGEDDYLYGVMLNNEEHYIPIREY